MRYRIGFGVRTVACAAILIAGASPSPILAASPTVVPLTLSDVNAVAVAHGALGIYVDDTGAPVVVTPADRSAEVVRSETASFGQSVRTRITDVTPAMKQGMHDDLTALGPKATGPFGYYFDLTTATEIVQTSGSGSEFAQIAAKYAGHIQIQTGATASSTTVTYDRMHDHSRFWGGAKVYDSGTGWDHLCSTGFEAVAKGGGYYYTTTAGHCFPQGTSVYSGAGFREGYVSSRNFAKWEIEWIYGGLYSPVIYNGTVTQQDPRIADDISSVPVYGRKFAWTNQTGYCRTGYASGRVCDWKVGGVDATYWQWDEAGHLVSTDNLYAYGGTPSVGGDSGGPVYYPYNGGALITGTIIGYTSTIFGTTNYSTKAYEAMEAWNLTLVCQGTCVVQL